MMNPKPTTSPMDHIIKSITYRSIILIILRVFLDTIYISQVSTALSYAGFDLDASIAKVAISYVLLLIPFALTIGNNAPSSQSINLLMLFILAPCTSYWSLSNESDIMMAIVFLSFILLIICIRIPTVSIAKTKSSPRSFLILYLVITFSFFAPIIANGGLSQINFSVFDIYDRRDVFTNNIANSSSSYLMSWFAKVLNPVAIAFLFSRKRYAFCTLLYCLQIIDFSITTYKAHLIYPFIAVFFTQLLSRKKSILERIAFVVICYCVFSLLIGFKMGTLPSALIARAFFSIAQNHFDYYQFFQENDFTYWSNSIINPFTNYQYNEPIPALIGYGRYQADESSFANTGFIASGYMHMGSLGVLIYTILLGLLLRLLDSITLHSNATTKAAIILVSLQLVNSDLTTAILTHGIAIAFISILLLRTNTPQTRRASLTSSV